MDPAPQLSALSRSSREFWLMISLLRESMGLETADCLREGSAWKRIDWEAFERILGEHRALFPVWRQLERGGKVSWLPDGARRRIGQRFKRLQLRQMGLVGTLLKVVAAFDAAEVPYVSLKGPALGQLLYGDSMARQSNDIDLLVGRGDFREAEAVLLGLGFSKQREPYDEIPDAAGLQWKLGYHRHYIWDEVGVELHWRASGVDHLFPASAEELIESAEVVQLGAKSVAILGRPYLRDYLTLHGSAHCWNRIRWLYEVAALGKDGWTGEVDQGRPELARCRIWRDQLVEVFFGSGACTGKNRSRSCSRLVFPARMSIRQLCDEHHYPGSVANALRRSFALLWVTKGMRGKVRYLNGLLRWGPVYARWPLPEKLNLLYLFLGPVYWLYVRIQDR